MLKRSVTVIAESEDAARNMYPNHPEIMVKDDEFVFKTPNDASGGKMIWIRYHYGKLIEETIIFRKRQWPDRPSQVTVEFIGKVNHPQSGPEQISEFTEFGLYEDYL